MDLLERDCFLDELGDLLRQAGAGRGHALFLGGEAGAGKTALIQRFRNDLGTSARVLAGACDPLATPRPLGPLLDIAAELDGELWQLANADTARHRLFSTFLAELARDERPTLVVVEDAHWSDEATLDLLRFLGRRIEPSRALLVVTFRDDEVGSSHPLQLVLGDLANTSGVCRMTLPLLSETAVRALCEGRDLDPVALYRQTGGNPFFVTEVLAVGQPGIPTSVRDAVLARAGRLSQSARAVLDASSVIRSPIDPWLLLRVVDAVSGAVEECIASGMLRAVEHELAFRHELAREAVLAALSPLSRIELHCKVLAALRSMPMSDPARLAHHAEEAGDRDAALAFAPEAARRAVSVHAHREAAAQYARALRFAEGLPAARRGALLEARSYECYLTDQVQEAIDASQAALEIWRQEGDRLKEGDTLRRLSRLYWLAGRRQDAERAGWQALAMLARLPPGPQLALAYSNISQLFLLAWNAEDAIAWGLKAITLAERLSDTETLVHALHNVGMARKGKGDQHANDLVERSLRLALDAELEAHAARAYGNFGLSHVVDYQFVSADRILAEGIDYCTERDLDQQRLYMLAWRGLSLFHQGRWTEATEIAAEVLRQPRSSPMSRIMALVALGRVRVRQGHPESGIVLDEALQLAAQTGELQRLGPVRVARAEAAWLAGNDECVVAEARETLDLVLQHKHRWLVGELAFWLWRAGALTTAPPAAFEPFALQIAGQWSQAAARWTAAGCPYEAAWALAESGDEVALRDALATFTRMGAVPAAATTARRLRTLGARGIPRGPRPATQANPGQLTPREVEVLALVAQELPNADIADRLYISRRTVAHHVSAILTKLGAHSRTEAAREAARLGIVG
jgi:DNA-binding CsgD family transcriptional regulator/tetratricopeptide (TPR) repeat protein